MTVYKVTQTIEARTQPDGNKSGTFYKFGDTFESSTTSQDGWIKIADKRWIPLSSCVAMTVEPPTVEPETFAAPAEIMARWKLADGTYTEYFTYKIA